jgi:hypothetical protein
MAVHRPHYGGDQDSFPRPLEKYGGGTEQGGGAPGGAPSRLWQCTPPLPLPASAPAPLGHIQVGTALGVAVPPNKVAVPHPSTSLLQQITAIGVAVPPGQHPEPSNASFF